MEKVSFQWKIPDLLIKNPDFLLKNVDFLLQIVDFNVTKQVLDRKLPATMIHKAKFDRRGRTTHEAKYFEERRDILRWSVLMHQFFSRKSRFFL